MIKIIKCSAIIFLMALPFAQANDVQLNITLNPLGKFQARSGRMEGTLKRYEEIITAKKLWVKVEDLKTEISLRDWLFHKHLHAKEHPEIFMTHILASHGQGRGWLHVNGVSKLIYFDYSKNADGKIETRFFVKPSDYKLKGSSFFFIKVEDRVEVIVTIDSV